VRKNAKPYTMSHRAIFAIDILGCETFTYNKIF
jgi:hypothetical protein